jgi:hypothetical protein
MFFKQQKKCPLPCQQNNPCINGICVSNSIFFGSSSCSCLTGYIGTNCEYGILKQNRF